MAFLSRRWGTNPEILRDTLTEQQFAFYLRVEGEARGSETLMQSYGVLAAIATAFGQKDALKKFSRAVMPRNSAGGRENTSELRRRLGKLMTGGFVKGKGDQHE